MERDGRLSLLAPAAAATKDLDAMVRGRESWVWAKLAEKELLLRAWRPRKFVHGEGHLYLGRSYRLALVGSDEPETPPIRLRGGFLELRRDRLATADEDVASWYRARGREWLPRRVAQHLPRFGLAPSPIDVREIGHRWASCSEHGLHFHWRVMTLPPAIVDYVIAHELAHVAERHHDKAFWALLRRAMPDFEQRREWLATNGAGSRVAVHGMPWPRTNWSQTRSGLSREPGWGGLRSMIRSRFRSTPWKHSVQCGPSAAVLNEPLQFSRRHERLACRRGQPQSIAAEKRVEGAT